jgi:hypothetical protein
MLGTTAGLLQSKPESDVVELNMRLNVLGWDKAQLDYQSLQPALAWIEMKAGVEKESSPTP